MSRPYVNVTSTNLIHEFTAEINGRLKDFTALDGVLGITLNGGLSRGYGDHLSEIDLVLYLDASQFELWDRGQSPLPLGITRIGSYLYDLKILNLEEERQRTWDHTALWDLSYARILYDPTGEIAELSARKLADKPERLEAEGLLFQCWWYYRLAGDIWIHRGDTVQGHFLLNAAAGKLLEALFIANREYVPHEKWIFHLSRSLPWTPEHWETRLLQMMGTGDFSPESLATRQTVIGELWAEIDAYIISKECPGYNLNVMHKTFYDLLNLLLQSDKVTVQAWKERIGLSALSTEPFIRCASIRGSHIAVNKEKLLSLNPEDLYSWHAAIVKQVLSEQ